MTEFTLFRSSTQSILRLNCWETFGFNTVDFDTIEKYVRKQYPEWLIMEEKRAKKKGDRANDL